MMKKNLRPYIAWLPTMPIMTLDWKEKKVGADRVIYLFSMTAANRAKKKQASITQQHASDRKKMKNVVSRLHVDGGREGKRRGG